MRASELLAWTVAGLTIGGGALHVRAVAGGDLQPFTEEAIQRGLTYVVSSSAQQYGLYGYGCGFADLDGDDDQDVIIIGRADGRVGIFENDGAGNFTDHTLTSGIPVMPEGSAFAAADLDGDGDVDIYFTQVGEANVLARNDGGFAFTDVALSAGVDNAGASKGPSLGDYDGDGKVDIYLPNYNGGVTGTALINSELYRNLGGNVFTPRGAALGVDDPGLGFQSVWYDYDLDGDLDLYLSNDRGHLNGMPNRLWRNDGGTFFDVSLASGAGVGLYSMGVACGDFDGSGRPDLYCTNIPGGGGYNNPLLLVQPDCTHVESSVAAAVDNPYLSWGSIFFDCNNDGTLDLYVNNMFDPNTLYVNQGFPCGEVAAAMGVQGSTGDSYSSAVADVDNDGDLDLLLNNIGGNVELFINNEGNQRNWARVHVRGQGDNTSAVGAHVRLRVEHTWQMQELMAGGNGYLGQNELVAHFGLDTKTVIEELIVTWPGGAPVRHYTSLSANQVFIADADRTGDVNADGVVNVTDLLRVLGAWGPCAPCGEDTDGSGVIDVLDLLNVLSTWG